MTTITFKCTSCQQVLKVGADKAGRKAKCIQCSKILIIPAASEEALPVKREKKAGSGPGSEHPTLPLDASPLRLDQRLEDEGRSRKRRQEEDEDDDDRPRKKSKENSNLLAKGMLVALIGMCVHTGGFFLGQIGSLLLMLAAMTTSPGLLSICQVLGKIGLVVGFGGLVTLGVGTVFWLFISNKKGAFGLAIATICLAAINIVAHLILDILPMLQSSRFGEPVAVGGLERWIRFGNSMSSMILVGVLHLSLIAALWILIGLYFRAVAQTFKDHYLARRGMFLVILSSLAFGYKTLLFIVMMIIFFQTTGGASRTTHYIHSILDMIGGGVLIFMFIMYILTTWAVRSLVEEG